jgi:altronate dehydratase small subunit
MTQKNQAIIIDQKDNVATAIIKLDKGQLAKTSAGEIRLLQDIEFGHKFSLMDIDKDDYVIKYGAQIGRASVPIKKGEHVHVHNIIDIVDEVRKVG